MEHAVSKAITTRFFNKLTDNLQVDVAIAGAGPSGLLAGYYLANAGYKVCIIERALAPGGGMWGGAMLFNEIVIDKSVIPIINELKIGTMDAGNGLFTLDAVEATAALIYRASAAGATIFNGISVEDVIIKNEKIQGLVINWAPVQQQRMHVDPLMLQANCVLEATGHPCEIAETVARKNNCKLNTPSGSVMGEMSLSLVEAEKKTVENTGQIYPGLFVSGMAANGVNGSFRMGPIFSGMLLSGKKAATLIQEYCDA